MNLYIASVDDYYAFATSSGAHIYINNASYTNSFFDGFDVSVNTQTNLAVSRTYATTLPAPYGSCVSDIDNFRSIFTDMFAANKIQYTQKSCFVYAFFQKKI